MTRIGAAPVQRHPLAQYPSAQRLDLSERLHGHTVADPYRWLTDPTDPRAVTGTSEQDRLAFIQHTGLDLEAVHTR